jgi:hypothetical protein
MDGRVAGGSGGTTERARSVGRDPHRREMRCLRARVAERLRYRGFFWNEIHVRGRRLLQEIDLLARTYGWTEGEILGMTDHRRRLYVGMALS